MKRMIAAGLMVLGAGSAMAAPAPAPPQAPIQVLVVGTYHFGNPGLDIHNFAADDVLSPRRQAELARLARALAAFRPTRVMVEHRSDAADLSLPSYRAFTAADLAAKRDEEVQIGYRLARLVGLREVEGIDEQPGPGEHDYFPYDKVQAWADAHGAKPRLDALNASAGATIDALTAAQKTSGVARLLMELNRPDSFNSRIDFYYDLLHFGDASDQPGAELNAGWYERNAKIFAKLMMVARPGDRIVVVYGSGHNYWLRHFAAQVPGYASVDVMPYLRKAAE